MGHQFQNKAELGASVDAHNSIILRDPTGNVRLTADNGFLYTTVGTDAPVKILNLTTLAATGSASESPVGSMTQFCGDSAPVGWLLANGSTVSKTGTYSDLFAIIGYKFDTSLSGDDFRLPDMRGSFPAGKSSSSPFDVIGNTGGSADSVNVEHNHAVSGQSAALTGTTNITGTVTNGAATGSLSSGTVSGGTVPLDHGHTVDSSGGGAVKRTLTGTVTSASSSSANITGSGTAFLTECSAGHQIQIDDTWYTIASIENDTSLTLTAHGGEEEDATAYCWPRAKPNDESLIATGTMVKMTGTTGTSGASVTITGTGTSFKTDIRHGWWINFGNNDDNWREVDYIVSDTQLVLTTLITVSAGTSWYALPKAYAQSLDEGAQDGSHPNVYFTGRHDLTSASYPGGQYTHAGDSSPTQFPPGLEAWAPWTYTTLNTESIGSVSVGASRLDTSSDYYDANNSLWMGAQFTLNAGHSTEGNTPFDVAEFVGNTFLAEYTGGSGIAFADSYDTTGSGTLEDTTPTAQVLVDSFGTPHASGGWAVLPTWTDPAEEHDHQSYTIDTYINSPDNCPEFEGASFFSSSYPFDNGRVITEIKKYGVGGTNDPSEAFVSRGTAPVWGAVYSEVGGTILPRAGACVEIRDSGSSGASLEVDDHESDAALTGASVGTGLTASLTSTAVTGSGDTGGTATVAASTSSNSGTGDGTDTNLPPYVVINYIIKY